MSAMLFLWPPSTLFFPVLYRGDLKKHQGLTPAEFFCYRKFGKTLQKRQLDIPEYAASFVNYKALKKVNFVSRVGMKQRG